MSKPNLEQLKKQAKELVRGHAARTPDTIAFIRAHHPAWTSATDDAIAAGGFQLSDAQWAIARSLGAASWPALVHQVAEVPLVAVRGIVVFPGQRLVLDVGRARSKAAIAAAQRGDGTIAVLAQRTPQIEEPGRGDLHAIGTLARIVAVAPAGEQQRVEVEGVRRVEIVKLAERDGMLVAETRPIDGDAVAVDAAAARRAAAVALEAIANQLPALPDAAVARSLMVPHLAALPADVQQQMLETDDPAHWMRTLAAALA